MSERRRFIYVLECRHEKRTELSVAGPEFDTGEEIPCPTCGEPKRIVTRWGRNW